jgi:hypothetical protein
MQVPKNLRVQNCRRFFAQQEIVNMLGEITTKNIGQLTSDNSGHTVRFEITETLFQLNNLRDQLKIDSKHRTLIRNYLNGQHYNSMNISAFFHHAAQNVQTFHGR